VNGDAREDDVQDGIERILKSTWDAYGSDAIDEAWSEFSLWEEFAPGYDSKTPHQQLFRPWYVHRWSPERGGVCPTRVFLDSDEPIVSGRRRYLEACLKTAFSFHEVVGVLEPHRYRTRDLLTGASCEDCHRPQPKPMAVQVGDILYGQCVYMEGVGQLEACAPVAIPQQHRRVIERRGRLPPDVEALSPGQQRRLDLRLRAIYFELAGGLLGTVETDGHPR
jgi:hypothetical protein